MLAQPIDRIAAAARAHWSGLLLVTLVAAALSSGKAQSAQPTQEASSAITLDRIVAVVNRQPILFSDIEDEFSLSVLDPSRIGENDLTPQQALQRLISRVLIQQQILQSDIQAAQPTPEEVAARLKDIRNQLPACVRSNCSSDDGWKTFLATHNLTPERVEAYLHNRLEVLRFIEMRFRQGIRIAPEDVEAYYREKLLPFYPSGQAPPPLDQVAPRIEEILLQQQVNLLFDEWLDNLQKQGEIEVLDPALELAKSPDRDSASAVSPLNPRVDQTPGSPAPSRRIDKTGAPSQ
jgi:hypothetical protein